MDCVFGDEGGEDEDFGGGGDYWVVGGSGRLSMGIGEGWVGMEIRILKLALGWVGCMRTGVET